MSPDQIIKAVNTKVGDRMVEIGDGKNTQNGIDYRTRFMSEEEIVSLYKQTKRSDYNPYRTLTLEEQKIESEKEAKLQENYAGLIYHRKTGYGNHPLTYDKYRSELVKVCRDNFDEKPLFEIELTNDEQAIVDLKEDAAQEKRAQEEYDRARQEYDSRSSFERLKMTISGKKPKASDYMRENTK